MHSNFSSIVWITCFNLYFLQALKAPKTKQRKINQEFSLGDAGLLKLSLCVCSCVGGAGCFFLLFFFLNLGHSKTTWESIKFVLHPALCTPSQWREHGRSNWGPMFLTFTNRPAVALFRSGQWAQTHSLHPPGSLGLRGEICSAKFWDHLQENRHMSTATASPFPLSNTARNKITVSFSVKSQQKHKWQNTANDLLLLPTALFD